MRGKGSDGVRAGGGHNGCGGSVIGLLGLPVPPGLLLGGSGLIILARRPLLAGGGRAAGLLTFGHPLPLGAALLLGC